MTDLFYKEYPQYTTTMARFARIAIRYPAAKVFSIGRSWLGREIYAIGVGNLQSATCIVGGTHATEYYGVLGCFRFCEEVLESLESGSFPYDTPMGKAIGERGLLFVPCLNPDGLELWVGGVDTAGALRTFVFAHCGGDLRHWQANARGVDLNHNFDAGFDIARRQVEQAGIYLPGPTKYGGPFPFSEPETRALADFCRLYAPRQVVALHSQGEEIYYQYGPRTPQQSALVAQMLASVGGYRVAQPGGTASHAGFKDWFIQETGRPGYTLEVGLGENPLPLEGFEEAYQKLGPMLAVLSIA